MAKKKNKNTKEKTLKKEEAKDVVKEEKRKEKNKEDVKTEETPSKKVLKTESKQVLFFGIIIVILFLSFFVPYFYTKNQRIFEYNNLTWQVEKDGDVTFYHTQFGKNYQGEYRGVHNTFLRNDPRTNNVPVVDMHDLRFYSNIQITTDKELLECEKQILVTDALAQMAQGIAFVETIEFGITDEELAQESNREYITCNNIPFATTIIHVKKGDESRITQSQNLGDCMIVEIASCEDNLLVAEKLILEVITELNTN